MRAANLALSFLVELAAFAGFAVWGSHVANPLTGIGLAAAAIVVWGLFAAPRSRRRLRLPWRVALELGVFLLAALAWGASGHPALGVLFAVAVAVNVAGLTVLRQWQS